MDTIARLKPNHFLKDLVRYFRYPQAELESRWVSDLQRLSDSEYITLLPQGRSALYLFCKAILPPGSRVLIPAYTCVAIPNAIVTAGMIPHFVDVNLQDGNYDLDALAKESKVAGASLIVVPAMWGNPSDYQSIMGIRQRESIPYIFTDAALALSSQYEGKPVASWGDASLLSFSSGKHINVMEGGALVTREAEGHHRFQEVLAKERGPRPWQATFRQSAQFWGGFVAAHPAFYPIAHALYHKTPLLNFLTPTLKAERIALPMGALAPLGKLQLALGSAQSVRLARDNEIRQGHQQAYLRAFHDRACSPSAPQTLSHFPVRLRYREKFFQWAEAQHLYLGGGLFEYSLPELPQFRCYRQGNYPNSASLAAEIVNLPTYPGLSVDQRDRVIRMVGEFIHQTEKSNGRRSSRPATVERPTVPPAPSPRA